MASADEVLLTAGDKVLLARRGEAKSAEVVGGLAGAERLNFDPENRRLFVACGGKTQQVLVFDEAYRRVASLGRPGGRLAGLYKGEDFIDVSDVAADGAGGFFVTEAASAPRRTARFDASGKLLREWYGGQQFYTFAVPDPQDPRLVWMDSQWGWLMQAEVDWAKRSWKVRACYRWSEHLDPLVFPTGKMAGRMFPFRANLTGRGKAETHLWFPGASLILRVDEAGSAMWPVSHLGRMIPNQFWNWRDVAVETYPQPFKEAVKSLGADPSKQGEVGQYLGFSWADADGDGKVQAGEMTLLPPKVHRNGHGFHGGPGALWMDPRTFDLYVSPRPADPKAAAGAGATGEAFAVRHAAGHTAGGCRSGTGTTTSPASCRPARRRPTRSRASDRSGRGRAAASTSSPTAAATATPPASTLSTATARLGPARWPTAPTW